MAEETAGRFEAPRQRRNALADGVARIRAPIRVKLLAAFLGIAGLIIALALTGVSELRKANQRTAEVIQDQTRIATFHLLQRSIQEALLSGTAVFAGTGGVSSSASPSELFREELRWMQTIVADATRGADRTTMVFRSDQAAEMRQRVRDFAKLSQEITNLHDSGNADAAKEMFESKLTARLNALDREVATLSFDLRERMHSRAKIAEAAFQRSQQLMLGASGLAVILALALGLSISNSIIHPVDQIRKALRTVARGDFSARVDVANRDELGELATRVNRTTARLGTLYDELETANRHKSQFLANMSHEFRTPMNSILGYTELIQDGIYGEVPEKIADPLARVDANGKALLALINDVLDVSKIEAGHLQLEIDAYDMAEIAESVRATVEPMAADKGLDLQVSVAPDLPAGQGDAARIRQILLNVVGNAVKFTDEGQVALGITVGDGTFTIGVEDTGPGISEDDQARIFDEFQQADDTTTKAIGGTGLGLAISRRLAEMHGGGITVESVLGQGARFEITLPVTAKGTA